MAGGGVNHHGKKGGRTYDWTWIASCDKRGHRTRASAKEHARKLRKAGRKGVRPYLCEACGHFHVGHIPTVVRKGVMSDAAWYGSGA